MSGTLLGLTPSLLAGLFLASPSTVAAPEDEDARLTAYFRAFLDEDFRDCPLNATTLGDHRFDDKLDDVSPRSRAVWAVHYRETLKELPKKVDRAKLSSGGRDRKS